MDEAGGLTRITAKDVDELAKRFNSTKEEAMGLLSSFSEFDSVGVRKSLINF